ncbi:MAG: hypothetical protein AVDCRST_MAG19-3729 [uncultured Thermomicrobiales bacterium]|uniref:Uncharacterized protein n=1 Tax=uncultured Thermomicrobiales bacterium TaxID=1645740 RepID=A0A6J4VIH0_9BACT|nr:MAG: hypothetical protein AVDCRST_MAG19-3729 [uncultured Thermomicrobiales bacterium]
MSPIPGSSVRDLVVSPKAKGNAAPSTFRGRRSAENQGNAEPSGQRDVAAIGEGPGGANRLPVAGFARAAVDRGWDASG